MKLYIVSDTNVILKNTGFIQGSYRTYKDAFDAASVGQFIHSVDVQEVMSIVNAGKMAVRVDGSE